MTIENKIIDRIEYYKKFICKTLKELNISYYLSIKFLLQCNLVCVMRKMKKQ